MLASKLVHDIRNLMQTHGDLEVVVQVKIDRYSDNMEPVCTIDEIVADSGTLVVRAS